jgi:hypothetical protein
MFRHFERAFVDQLKESCGVFAFVGGHGRSAKRHAGILPAHDERKRRGR